jgi:hypothetical protein
LKDGEIFGRSSTARYLVTETFLRDIVLIAEKKNNMASTTSRGNMYKKKTMEYFQSLGYVTQLTEFMTARHIGPNRVIYIKKDVFGADGISMNGKEIIFWNSKHGTTASGLADSKASGKKDFNKFPFPPTVKRQIVFWEPRKKPIIIDVI